MAVLNFLDSFFASNCAFMHGARRGALVRVVGSLLDGAKLNLTSLGRYLSGDGLVKHRIKLVDRLLGNRHLDAERRRVYQHIAAWTLAGSRRPLIAIDWSDLEEGNRTQLLKAAVCVRGRALTVYDEVHHVAGIKRARAERIFLKRLAALLPAGCRPVIVTDAGFQAPWFRQVEALGWDYVGRVRGNVNHRAQTPALIGEKGTHPAPWQPVVALHAAASAVARCLGTVTLSKDSRLRTRLCLYRGHQPKAGRRRSKRAPSPKWREPWVLATSLSGEAYPAHRVVGVYRRRMQIEETFRDMKAARWGLAMQFSRSRTLARRANLALVASLALFALWLLGLAARTLGWHRHFQANTVHDRTVLSDVFLGREVYRNRHRYVLGEDIIEAASRLLRLGIQELNASEAT